MFKLIKKMTCSHKECKTLTNFHGDLINKYNCRSIKRCKKCGSWIKSDELDKNCKVSNWMIKD